MSGNEGNPDKGSPGASRKTPLLGARALLSRQLNSASPSPGRLPSLRPARDLTLGATPKLSLSGTAKRTFTPNIPTRRIKQEPKDDASHTQENPRGRRRQDEGRGRGRGRGRGGRGKPNIVQSSSVFSMGVGPIEKQRLGSSVPSYGLSGGKDSVSSIKVKKERTDEDDEEESKRVLKMLQGNGDFDEDMDGEAGVMPVQLPLSFHALQAKEKAAESVTLGADVKVESEPTDIDMIDAKDTKKEETSKKPVRQITVKEETTNEDTVFNLLSTQSVGEQKLLFFQFPDVLPIKPVASDQGEPMSVDETSNEQPAAEGKPKQQKKLSLKDASEGYIGKLQLLKSGKTRLLLGDVSLDVTMGTPCGFLQDVVSVHTEDNRSEMICLGHVKQRLICTPDFEQLLASS